MSKFKVGDRVRVLRDDCLSTVKTGDIVTVSAVNDTYIGFGKATHAGWDDDRFALVEGEKPKGTFETLVIESHPQGGYSVITSGCFARAERIQTLAAFSTVTEALKFVGENLK